MNGMKDFEKYLIMMIIRSSMLMKSNKIWCSYYQTLRKWVNKEEDKKENNKSKRCEWIKNEKKRHCILKNIFGEKNRLFSWIKMR